MSAVTVIGGSGFVGTRFVARLNSNFDVSIIDKRPSDTFPNKYQYSDIRSLDNLRKNLITDSIVVNLAAEHRDDVSPQTKYYDVNVQGAINICKIATEKKIKKIIFTSSVAVYGFAPPNTNELGIISPFNEYGRTKWLAENIYKEWQSEAPESRVLVIIRPTVIFGERNRGNVFNLLKQVSTRTFLMVGNGCNRKSMAYVENVAAFIEYSLSFNPGVHIYNYIDKPDFTMNALVSHVNKLFGRSSEIKLRIPLSLGLFIGSIFDLAAIITGKKFPISAIRVKKFCADSVFESAIDFTDFIPPISLIDALERTVRYEFIEDNKTEQVYYSE
jgi:nucleoside-diphosphate-sugar epimerase